jgi:hypothetical protein
MSKQGYGRLIGIVSDAARVGGPRLAVYAGAKAAIVGFMKSVAGEYARFGITANCISLGAFIHEDIDQTWGTPEEREKRREMFLQFYPLAKKYDRLTLGSDAAYAVAVMASRRSEWITGQVFASRGGVNAIYKAAGAVGRLERFRFDAPAHALLTPTTLNVGTISGGCNINSVPDRADFTVDVRSAPGCRHNEILRQLQQCVDDDVAFSTLLDLEGIASDPCDPWIRRVFDTVEAITTQEVETAAAP